jgi:hypothetical protein
MSAIWILCFFRALEVFKDHGERLSEIIADQRRLPGRENNNRLFPHIVEFINHCVLLNERIDNGARKICH